MKARRLPALVCGLAMALGSHAATAADGAPDKAAEQASEKRFREGVKLFHQGDYERARVAFEEANALAPRWFILRNLAVAELQLAKPLDALRHLRTAMIDPRARRAELQHDLDSAYAATGHLGITTTDGAALSIDGEAMPAVAPFREPVDVAAGHHVIEARLGEQSGRAEVDAKAGAVVPIEVRLAPAAPAPTVATGTMGQDNVPPGAGSSDAAPRDAASSPGFWSTRRDVGLIVAGAGVLAVGAGMVFMAAAQNHATNAQSEGLSPSSCTGPSQAPSCASAASDRDAQRTDATLNRVFLGVGVAGLVAGAGLFLWPSSGSRVAVAPLAAPSCAGLLLRGDL